MKHKLNIDVFLLAAEMIDSYEQEFSCLAIDRAQGKLAGDYWINMQDSKELKFYQSLFTPRSRVFSAIYKEIFGVPKGCGDGYSTVTFLIELRQMRVFALLFAAEMARYKNNKK